jgi:hypothetical protein
MKRRSGFRFVLEGIEGAALMGAALCTWPVSKRWLEQWGSRSDERHRRWPGDELTREGARTFTRAIDIAVPASTVWKWLAQFGMDRAGFYSYELLERIAGIPVTNIESVEPAMQSIEVGDEIRLHPKAPGIPIGLLEPERYICFGALPDQRATGAHPGRSWSFYVVPVTPRSSRLLVRGCVESPRDGALLARIGLALEVPVDFVMEQRMLRTIKRLAEGPET